MPPGLVVGTAGVGRRGTVQRVLYPALVLGREAGGRQISGILMKGVNGHITLVPGQAGGFESYPLVVLVKATEIFFPLSGSWTSITGPLPFSDSKTDTS